MIIDIPMPDIRSAGDSAARIPELAEYAEYLRKQFRTALLALEKNIQAAIPQAEPKTENL